MDGAIPRRRPERLATYLVRSRRQADTLGDKALHNDFSTSPDLKKLAVSVSDPRVGPPDLWIYEAAHGLRTRFTFERGVDSSPVWSLDGSRVVFSSIRKGNFDFYITSYAGSPDEELLLMTEHAQFAESWSSDGRYVAYYSRGVPGTGTDMWVLPLSPVHGHDARTDSEEEGTAQEDPRREGDQGGDRRSEEDDGV